MAVVAGRVEAPIERIEVSAFRIPTERPESDGTFRVGLDHDRRGRDRRGRGERARLHVPRCRRGSGRRPAVAKEQNMSEQHPRDERFEQFDIVYEPQPSSQGTYQYGREDGTVVQGDASGEWTFDEDGRGHRLSSCRRVGR
jgi:hypothetical protein